MKKILLTISFIIITILLLISAYKLTEYLDYKTVLSKLENYKLIDNEKIVKSFNYDKHNYVITKYYDNKSSWSHVNILLRDKKDFYVIEKIKNCDVVDDGSNLYVYNNDIYFHCIGKYGDIEKYTLKKFYMDKSILKFNYDKTPNISEIHMGIDKVNDRYIYLSSPVKKNSLDKNEPKVKCSIKTLICEYYMGGV